MSEDQDSCMQCGEMFPVEELNHRYCCEYCQDPHHEDSEDE